MADDFAEALAEAVDGNLDGTFAEIELSRGFRLWLGGSAGQPGLEDGKGCGLAGGFHFLGQVVEGAVEDEERPFAVEIGIRRGLDGVGREGTGGLGGFVGEGFGNVAGAAFLALGQVALVLEEVFDGAEEVGSEAAEGGVGAANIPRAEESGEEFLGEFAGGVLGAALGA